MAGKTRTLASLFPVALTFVALAESHAAEPFSHTSSITSPETHIQGGEISAGKPMTNSDATLLAAFLQSEKDYAAANGENLTSNIQHYSELKPAQKSAVESTLLKLLNAPANASLRIKADDSGSAFIAGKLLIGDLVVDGKTLRYMIDLDRGMLFFNDTEVKLTDAKARIDELLKAIKQSIGSAPFAFSAAIQKMLEAVGPGSSIAELNSKTPNQLLSRLSGNIEKLPKIGNYVSAVAQKGGVDKINKFLEENGFSIRLSPSGSSDSISSAAAVDVRVTWEQPGTRADIALTERGTNVAGVQIANPVAFYSAKNHAAPVVELKTSGKERFFITRFEKKLSAEDPFAATDAAAELSKGLTKLGTVAYPNGVMFPMADCNSRSSMDFLTGMAIKDAKGQAYPITQALFESRFRLNEFGARGQAAAAVYATISEPLALIIDGPYLAWFEIENGDSKGKNESTIIPFAILVLEDDMREPQNL